MAMQQINEVCDLKSIVILKAYDKFENPGDSHEHPECVCIQLHFVLWIVLIACVAFIFFSSVGDARCPSIKATKATGCRSLNIAEA